MSVEIALKAYLFVGLFFSLFYITRVLFLFAGKNFVISTMNDKKKENVIDKLNDLKSTMDIFPAWMSCSIMTISLVFICSIEVLIWPVTLIKKFTKQ